MIKKIKDKLIFGKNFFKQPAINASVIPSSKAASRAMLSGVDFSLVDNIIELGPGTGVMTEEIIKKAKPDIKIILIEIEKEYVQMLEDKFSDKKNVIIENTSAHLLDNVLKKHNLTQADLIVSGLPFLVIREHETGPLFLNSIKEQTEKGVIFRFFTYMPLVAKKAYKDLPVKKIVFVPQNIPPMWIYGVN